MFRGHHHSNMCPQNTSARLHQTTKRTGYERCPRHGRTCRGTKFNRTRLHDLSDSSTAQKKTKKKSAAKPGQRLPVHWLTWEELNVPEGQAAHTHAIACDHHPNSRRRATRRQGGKGDQDTEHPDSRGRGWRMCPHYMFEILGIRDQDQL